MALQIQAIKDHVWIEAKKHAAALEKQGSSVAAEAHKAGLSEEEYWQARAKEAIEDWCKKYSEEFRNYFDPEQRAR